MRILKKRPNFSKFGKWLSAARQWVRKTSAVPPQGPVIGLALGGGFARGIAHLGILRVLEEAGIPIGMIAGISAGAICAAAYASGASTEEIGVMARSMRFRDVARWRISRLGFAGSEPMADFLTRLVKVNRFERMRLPLAVVATDLCTGQPVVYRDHGDVFTPVRASCSYPGLFRPVRHEGRLLVDGAISMEVPAQVLKEMGATHVISVALPLEQSIDPGNVVQVVRRCLQILQSHNSGWRAHSDLILEPDVHGLEWDAFVSAEELVAAGEEAARAVLPQIQEWFEAPAEPVLAIKPELGGPLPAGRGSVSG